MLRRIIIVLMTFFIFSCQTINIEEPVEEKKKIKSEGEGVMMYAFKKESVNDISKEIKKVERKFKHTVIEARRYGSSVRFKLPHHANFNTASYSVTEPLEKEILFILSNLEDTDYKSIKVFGFADSRGDEKYNKELSEKRAKSVSDIFKDNIDDAVEIAYRGIGEEIPVAENESSYGRLLNRRTEIVVYFN